LYYSKDGQGRSRVTPKELLEAVCGCDRIGSCSRSCGRKKRSITCDHCERPSGFHHQHSRRQL